MSDMILQVNHLSKSFGSHEVLKDIDFTVAPGDVTSIIGASGSGKSTLLRCINLLETPTSGEILYHGENVAGRGVNAAAYRSHVGMVFQSFNLFNNMTVLENCMVGQVKVLKKSKEEARVHAMEYLEKVGMAPYINARPRQISGGQKQRVAIARALAMDPEVLLFDEPTSAGPRDGGRSAERHAGPGPRGHDHAGGDPRDGFRPGREQPCGVHEPGPHLRGGHPGRCFRHPPEAGNKGLSLPVPPKLNTKTLAFTSQRFSLSKKSFRQAETRLPYGSPVGFRSSDDEIVHINKGIAQACRQGLSHHAFPSAGHSDQNDVFHIRFPISRFCRRYGPIMRICGHLSTVKLHRNPTGFVLLPLLPKRAKKPCFNLSNLLIAGRREIRYNRYDL